MHRTSIDISELVVCLKILNKMRKIDLSECNKHFYINKNNCSKTVNIFWLLPALFLKVLHTYYSYDKRDCKYMTYILFDLHQAK